jgi:hypothetical protein
MADVGSFICYCCSDGDLKRCREGVESLLNGETYRGFAGDRGGGSVARQMGTEIKCGAMRSGRCLR